MAHVLKRMLFMFLAEETVPVEITSPACGSTLTNAEVTVIWSFSPGTQFSYRLRVYEDVALTSLVYDTSVVVSSAMTTTIPFGVLSTGQTYYAVVNVFLTDGTEGVSDPCAWTTDFSPSVDVTGVELELIGACSGIAPYELPGVRVTWDQVVAGPLETFIAYDVKRRISGETVWTRIAQISTVTTTSYIDYNVMPGVTYEYAVTWLAASGPDILVSIEQSPPPFVTPEWEHLFIHDVDDPSKFVRYDSFEGDESVEQDIQYVQLAGRQAPTAQIGERQGRRFSVPALSRPYEEPLGPRWVDLEELVTRQRTLGSVLCARFGKANVGVFCQIAISRSYNQGDYEMDIEIIETFYSEAV